MQFANASFTFRDKECGSIQVSFFRDGECVEVTIGGKLHRIDNTKRAYKPCITHCLDLIKFITYKPPANNFSKRRIKEQRPKLAVYK